MATSRKISAAQKSPKIDVKEIPEFYECLPDQFAGTIRVFPSETRWNGRRSSSLRFCRVEPLTQSGVNYVPNIYILAKGFVRELRYFTIKERKALANALGVDLKTVESKYLAVKAKDEKEDLEYKIHELRRQAERLGYNIRKLNLKEKAAIANKKDGR